MEALRSYETPGKLLPDYTASRITLHSQCHEHLNTNVVRHLSVNTQSTVITTYATCFNTNKKIWEELIAYFHLLRHGPNIKRRPQQLFHCYMCIRYRDNVFTLPFLSNDRGMHIYAHRLMGEIYEVSR
jgi:hypothetical protein